MRPQTLPTLEATRSSRFEVHLCADLLEGVGVDSLRTLLTARRVMVCTTPTVDRLYGAKLKAILASFGLEPAWLVLACPESAKTTETALRICEAALEVGLDRRGIMIGFGGGACSDLVSVAASMTRRGIHHVRLPTTLVGQIDAGIGIKGAVNLGAAKNFLGCFHPPAGVIVDPQLLRTLPTVALRQGMAEIIKIACIRDSELFEVLWREGGTLIERRFDPASAAAVWVIERAIAGMLHELAQNPFEDRSHARAVDFGHTISPTLEAATGYRLHHGDAVAIDVAFSSLVGEMLGLLPAADAEAIISLLARTGLPITHELLDAELVAAAFQGTTLHRGGALNLVVPTRIGACTFVARAEIDDRTLVVEALERLRRWDLRGLQSECSKPTLPAAFSSAEAGSACRSPRAAAPESSHPSRTNRAPNGLR